jgi:hypothetical protein
MTRRRYLSVHVAFCFFFFVAGLSAQTLQIINAEGRSTSISAGQIANLPRVTVEVHDHDVPPGSRVGSVIRQGYSALGTTSEQK